MRLGAIVACFKDGSHMSTDTLNGHMHALHEGRHKTAGAMLTMAGV